MEILLGIAVVVLVLAFPILSIVALVRVQTLRAELSALRQRIETIEEGGFAPSARPTATTTPVVSAPVAAEPEPAAPTPPMAGSVPGPPPLPPTAVAPPPPRRGFGEFEESFGTRWVVWVGGLALALGGIFLVRYSIEAGLVGPGARIALGALFAAVLIAAGEWMRRQDRQSGFVGLPSAYVPAVLTAAGTVAAYATVWAAYELYDFLAPAAAFVLLGVVAVATIVAALLHGPALAAIGTLGAYAAPALVSTDEPNALALFLFVAVVTGSAYAVARIRGWRWLAATATGLAVGWGALAVDGVDELGALPMAIHVGTGLALAAALIVPGLLYGPAANGRRIDGLASAAPAAFAAVAALFAVSTDMSTESLVVFGGALAAVIAIAWRAPAAAAAVPGAALLAAAVGGAWAINIDLTLTVAPAGATGAPDPSPVVLGPMLAFASLAGAGFLGAGVVASRRQNRGLIAVLWAAGAVLAPTLLLAAAYYRIAGWVASPSFGALALVLAAAFAMIAETSARRRPVPGTRASAAIFITGGLAALALGLTMMLERGWLTVALALVAFGAAYVARVRPYPFLRWVAAAAAMVLAARLGWEPRIMGGEVGRLPILNWLLWGYGAPTAALAAGAHLLRQRRDDAPVRILEGLSIVFGVLLATLEIRHLMNGGDIAARATHLAEAGLQVSVLAAIALGLERVQAVTGSVVHRLGASLLAALAALGALGGLLFAVNPLWADEWAGDGLLLNNLLLGYAMPAALLLALYVRAPTLSPQVLRTLAGLAALLLGFVYVTCEVALAFRGGDINIPLLRRISDAELYGYSAVWLVYGLALLGGGIAFASKPARLASAAIVTLTVVKVFLSDMADLQGVLRAMSFIGLGLVLVGIGWLYQRLLFRRAPAPTQHTPPPLPPG